MRGSDSPNAPRDWKPEKIRRISSLKGRLGWQGLKAHEYLTEGPYVVSSAHFREERIVWDLCPRVSPRRYERDANIQLQVGDVLLMKDGAAMGKLAFVDSLPGPACLNSHLLLFRPHGNTYDPKYLFYVLDHPHFRRYSKVHGTGVTFAGLSQRLTEEYVVHLPTLSEQRRMAAILDTLDEAIRRTEQVIEKLKQMKQGLLHDLLTRGIDDNGELRPPPDEAPHLYKDSPLGRIPKGWENVPLEKLLALTYRYPTYYGIEYVSTGVPEVRGEVVQGDGSLNLDLNSYRRISEATARRFPKVRLEAGDFVMTVRGTIGKIAEVPSWLSGAVITANLLRLCVSRDRAQVCWMRHYLLSPQFQFALDLACSATTIKTIQVPALLAISVAIPPLTEQRRVSAVLKAGESRWKQEHEGLAKLRTLKQGLMDDLLTGRVRVPIQADPDRVETPRP